MTLTRTVGYVAWAWETQAGQPTEFVVNVNMGIVVVDQDFDSAFPPRPDDATSLVRERWLWTDGFRWSGSDWNFEKLIPIDIKQRARLRDSVVLFIAVADFLNTAEAPGVQMTGVFRMLLAGDMT